MPGRNSLAQKFSILIDKPRQFCQQMFDVIIDIQIVRTGSLSKAVNDGARLGTADRIDRHAVLPADRKIPQRPLRGGIVDRNLSPSVRNTLRYSS